MWSSGISPDVYAGFSGASRCRATFAPDSNGVIAAQKNSYDFGGGKTMAFMLIQFQHLAVCAMEGIEKHDYPV
ncbi:hypothetical protein [Pseudomonas syringae]|uniref:hypothetical protein n=1 Tax=Pseudomonas syringae TaxID=317 RepID=UPI00126941F3|nr:hypothetical protein [Pseudomonas syringae]